MSNLAAEQCRMPMAGLHAHESNLVTVENLKWKNAILQKLLKFIYCSWRWQDCLECRPKSPVFIHAMLSLSQPRSGNELECLHAIRAAVRLSLITVIRKIVENQTWDL